MATATELTIDDLRRSFDRFGQGHVFAHWDRLDAAGRDRLFAQAARLAPQLPALLPAAHRAAAEGASAPAQGAPVEPAEAIALPDREGEPAAAERARKRGDSVLAAGRLGVFLVAGGQGTRLGFDGPKGCFPVGPVTERSLFEIQAQKIRGLARRIGRCVPWYVMTSEATDADTRAFFDDHGHFGLDPADIMIFTQDTVPAFDFEGRLLLERMDRIFENPNGHGGSLTALESSGALDDMDRRGIDTLFYYQVDNPLVQIGDPVYLGYHDEAGAEMSCKVVRKVDPAEKVGVVARVGGRVGVIEYTELQDGERFARAADDSLIYWAGNVAIHLLSTDFIRRIAAAADEHLPYHCSEKKIPSVDASGRPAVPETENGHKLERFVFDALPVAERVCVVEASAADEFSPIKNASGADSPETSRRDLIALYRRWLEAAGVSSADVERIEIDHSVIDGPRDAAAAGIRSLAEAGDTIRVA